MRLIFIFFLYTNINMFNELRMGMNTRLYSKNSYDKDKNKFLENRNNDNSNILKPINQRNIDSFNKFNDDFNTKYEEMSKEYLKNFEKTNDKNKNYTKKISFKKTNKPKNINSKLLCKKKNLSKVVFKVLKKKFPNLNEDNITKYLQRYNLDNNNYNKSILKSVINDINNDFNLKIKTNMNFNNKFIKKEILVNISSNDRDNSLFPEINTFNIKFIQNNIFSIQLMSVIFPKFCVNGDNLEDYPYIILEIDEFGTRIENSIKSPIFAQLTFDIDLIKFKKSVPNYNDEYLVKFETLRNFNSLNIKIKKPNGELYNFGTKQKIQDKDYELKNTENKKDTFDVSYDPNDLNQITNNFNKNKDIKNDIVNNYEINFIFKITKIINSNKFNNFIE